MQLRKTNWLGETTKTEIGRRLNAVEIHIQDLETRYSALENEYLLLKQRVDNAGQTTTDKQAEL